MMQRKRKLLAVLFLSVALPGTAWWGVWEAQNVAAQTPGQAADKPAAADLCGDPLPAHALARLGTIRWRHTDTIHFIGFVEKGKQVLTVAENGAGQVWDAESGKVLRRFGTPEAGPATGDEAAAVGLRFLGSSIACALSADGATLATTQSRDGQTRLWDVASGKERDSFKVERGVTGLVFAPDGKSLLVRTGDQVVRHYEVATGKELRQFGKATPPNRSRVRVDGDVALAPDGTIVAACGTETVDKVQVSLVRCWAVASGKELAAIKIESRFGANALNFTADGKHLAWSNGDGSLSLAEVADFTKVSKRGEGKAPVALSGLAFTQDGKTWLEKHTDQTVHQREVESGKSVRQLGEPVNQGGNGLFLAIPLGGSTPREMALSPDGKTLAVAGGLSTIRLWDMESGKERQAFGGHRGAVSTMVVSADGKTASTRGTDNTIRQWDLATGKEIHQLPLPPGASTVAFSPDGQSAAVVVPSGEAVVYDVATGKDRQRIKLSEQPRGRFGAGVGLAFAPDGKTLATKSAEPVVRLWDLATGKEILAIAEDKDEAAPPGAVVFLRLRNALTPALAFTQDGTAVATVSSMNAGNAIIVRGQPAAPAPAIVRLWHVATGKPLARFETGPNCKAFVLAPYGRSVATIHADQTISVREVASGKERCQFKAAADTLAFAPDGRSLATAGSDRKVRVWDLTTGKELGQFNGHRGDLRSLAFAPHGRQLISGGDDSTALVWDATTLASDTPAVKLDAKQLEAHWADLIGVDAAKAYQGMWALSQAPAQSLPWLREHLKPTEGVPPERLQELLAGLQSEKFAERQEATTELEKLGDLAVPALEKALAAQPTLEIRQRVERVLARLVEGQQTPQAETLRAIRAVEVLHQVGTPEARQLLEALTRGASARLTREAQKSLALLARRPAP